MTALADKLANAKSISDIEAAIAAAEVRKLSFVELMGEKLDDERIKLIVEKAPTLAAWAEQRNLLTYRPLLDAYQRVMP